jgi:FkbM family methyltransferase
VIRSLSRTLGPFRFRGKARLLHSLCPRQGQRNVEVFGYRIRLDLSDYIQRSIYLGTFESEESFQVKRHLKRGMTFVDAGANVGYYTLMAASLVDATGKVFAFEPSPYAFRLLFDTLAENSITQALAVHSALSDTSGEMQLFMPKRPGNHTPSMVPNNGGTPITVPVLKLDDYLSEHEIGIVDLLKLDVEGFEPNVIKGAEQYLRRKRIRAILCEFNEPWLRANGTSSSDLYELLSSFGFKSVWSWPRVPAEVRNLLFRL